MSQRSVYALALTLELYPTAEPCPMCMQHGSDRMGRRVEWYGPWGQAQGVKTLSVNAKDRMVRQSAYYIHMRPFMADSVGAGPTLMYAC